MMMIDTTDLLRNVNLGALVERDLGPALKRSGRWLFWRCPFHDDSNPSFAVTPDGGHYHCFGCGASGDAITWLREREGLSFLEACQRLGALDLPARPVHVSRPAPDDADIPPPAAWQERSRALVIYAQGQLWGEVGREALAYLRRRGLGDDAIRTWGLGWNPADRRDRPERWGLTGRKVWLPSGVVIPCEAGGAIWYVKIRRLGDDGPPTGGNKYVQVREGKAALFGIDLLTGKRVVVICEGELDAVLLWQEAGNLVDVVAIGSKSAHPALPFLAHLTGAARWLVALDNDADDAVDWWGDFSTRVRRVRPLQGNDLTDFYQTGGDLRAWVAYHLERLAAESGFEDAPGAFLSDETAGFQGAGPTPAQGGARSAETEASGAFPMTLRFPAGLSGLGVPVDRWRRLDSGEIEATYETREELELGLAAACDEIAPEEAGR